ncbi:S-adenosylmethionine decarboxylase related protein [Fictibacillus arsenicus]|uniref:S-adenosylmethionine decarboxylase related protein n=1 Tax=Fictibacillus arsenicus TaxID=255247 RepID=A0A1V3GDJ7_9BACL|nr:S-adenosylmethionine decarboxylase related protein [Fictibacillus arsenicus]OOE14877.1 S-adenosylmethionine decarboxylase related protein [Fictibacillus arsenicus]
MTQTKRQASLTILGSSGGGAKAILSILNQAVIDKNDPLHEVLNTSTIHLIDIQQKTLHYFENLFPNLSNQIYLYEQDLKDLTLFKEHLHKTNTTIVIDVSWADTIDMLTCCNELGVYYLNSALENIEVDEDETLYGFPLAERFKRFEEKKHLFTNTKAIVSSGMNPGVVQWMAHELIKKNKNTPPLACYIIEHDTSFFSDIDLIKKDTIYTSWSVECFLDEAILSYPMFVSHQLPLYMYEEVYSNEYMVKLGDKKFQGCLMPHEEILSLGKLYDIEFGFIYRVNEHTTKLIRDNLYRVDDLWDWTHQLLDPELGEIEGEDLVGVLLVFEDHEEYMYNVMNTKQIYPKYKTNATYFQVACGLYGGLASLLLDSIPNGAHYVDELLLQSKSKYGEYLSYHMQDFVIGKNESSDGLLHQRIKRIT